MYLKICDSEVDWKQGNEEGVMVTDAIEAIFATCILNHWIFWTLKLGIFNSNTALKCGIVNFDGRRLYFLQFWCLKTIWMWTLSKHKHKLSCNVSSRLSNHTSQSQKTSTPHCRWLCGRRSHNCKFATARSTTTHITAALSVSKSACNSSFIVTKHVTTDVRLIAPDVQLICFSIKWWLCYCQV